MAEPLGREGEHFMGAVRIRRPTQWADVLRHYRIFVDGQNVAKIARDTHVQFDLPAGQHTIIARIDWCSSNSIVLDVEENSLHHLEVGSRIKRGMTRSDVEAILGPPVASTDFRWPNGTRGVEIWQGGVRVAFTSEGRVVDCGWYSEGDRSWESLFDRAGAWAQRQWHRWFP
jgi:hypothetical protein